MYNFLIEILQQNGANLNVSSGQLFPKTPEAKIFLFFVTTSIIRKISALHEIRI